MPPAKPDPIAELVNALLADLEGLHVMTDGQSSAVADKLRDLIAESEHLKGLLDDDPTEVS